jgi:hypothetical protein
MSRAAPRFGDNMLIDKSDWRAYSEQLEEELRQGVLEVKNQGNEGSCVGFAGTQCVQIRMRWQMAEQLFVKLSGCFAYMLNPSAGGPNTGSFVSDVPKVSGEIGYLPLEGEGYPHEWPQTGWSRRRPDGFEETAKLFRATWEYCGSREAIFSACFQFKPVIIGRRGHSICYFLPIWDGSKWLIGYVNSWSLDWGDVINDVLRGGMGWDTWNNMARTGYACESVTERGSGIWVPE